MPDMPDDGSLHWVTSLAEVWIEMISISLNSLNPSVTSLAEVWIEITYKHWLSGLVKVTSLAEVWIEIEGNEETIQELKCHFPCGSVD